VNGLFIAEQTEKQIVKLSKNQYVNISVMDVPRLLLIVLHVLKIELDTQMDLVGVQKELLMIILMDIVHVKNFTLIFVQKILKNPKNN